MCEYQGCCSGNPEEGPEALEDGGGERWAAEEVCGLGEWSRLPGAEQRGVLAGREEAASACGVPGRNVWF